MYGLGIIHQLHIMFNRNEKGVMFYENRFQISDKLQMNVCELQCVK